MSCVRLDGALSNWFFFGNGVRQGCTVAPSLFLLPVDGILHRTNQWGFIGATLGAETFTDLDYADDVALMLEISVISSYIRQTSGCRGVIHLPWLWNSQYTGSSEPEVRRLIGLEKCCFNLLNRGIWRSSTSLPTDCPTISYLYACLLAVVRRWTTKRLH